MNQDTHKTYAFEFIGRQVRVEKSGRVYLGDVKDATPINGGFNLYVRHFNGEPWPFSPMAADVQFLDEMAAP